MGEVDVIEMRPVDSAQTHRTRFARRVDDATLQRVRIQLLARQTDRDHFSMCRWIVERNDSIGALGNDFSIPANDS